MRKNMRKTLKRRIVTVILSLVFAFQACINPVYVKASEESPPTIACDTSYKYDFIYSRMINDINYIRTQNGVHPLILDDNLNNIAKVRAFEISSFWSHTRPNGSKGCDLIDSSLYRGENLAYVQFDSFSDSQIEQVAAETVMFSNLCNSPAHMNNMLYPKFTKIGIACFTSTDNGKTKITFACMFSN